MMFTLGVTALWTAAKSVHGSNLPIVAFALTGYSSVLLWRNMPSRTIGSVAPNVGLLYHRNVRIVDIYLARVALEAAGATISFVVLSIVFVAIEWLEPPEDMLQITGGWFMLAWFGASLALTLGALSQFSETVEKLWHPAAYILFPLSGAAFLVNALPEAAQRLVLLLPMVHGVEYVREGYFGSKVIAHYDLAYMALFNLGLTLFGLAQTRKAGQTVIPE
jgi:ABC-type polysaccharide/polyol phosphate export permease